MASLWGLFLLVFVFFLDEQKSAQSTRAVVLTAMCVCWDRRDHCLAHQLAPVSVLTSPAVVAIAAVVVLSSFLSLFFSFFDISDLSGGLFRFFSLLSLLFGIFIFFLGDGWMDWGKVMVFSFIFIPLLFVSNKTTKSLNLLHTF